MQDLGPDLSGTALRSAHPTCSKANPLTPGCGEGKYNIYCRASSKKNKQLVLKRPKLPLAFRQGYLKTVLREMGHRICHQLVDNFPIDWWCGSRLVVR